MIDVKSSSLLKGGICAPVGGFGNHVRWLALLDPCFQFDLTPLAEPRFKKIPDLSRRINFLDADSKLESFCTQIYSPKRSWNNWLWTEWLYRDDLDSVLVFNHYDDHVDSIDKSLVLTVDPDLALLQYFKLNSNLNHRTPGQFKQTVQQFNNNAYAHAKKKTINVDCLYRPTLDRGFYNNMIEWFELSDCYYLANRVHEFWFAAHERAQKEFVEYVNSYYKRVQ